MSRYFVAEPGGVVRPAGMLEWGRWFEASRAVPFADGGRRVALTTLAGGVEVSTVLLGLDHSFGGGPPLIFETMIFGGPHDDYQKRYTTAAEALAGHAHAVRLACGETTPED